MQNPNILYVFAHVNGSSCCCEGSFVNYVTLWKEEEICNTSYVRKKITYKKCKRNDLKRELFVWHNLGTTPKLEKY